LLSVDKMWNSGWKIDKLQFLMNFLWAFLTYVILPMIVWSFSQAAEINIQIDTNTYFAVFAVFLIIRICRNLVHPPMYRIIKEEDKIMVREERAYS